MNKERIVRRLVKAYLSDPDVAPQAWSSANIDEAAGFHVHVYSATIRVPEGYISDGICTSCGEITHPDLMDRVLRMRSRS